MTVIAVTMVKDEADIIGPVIAHLLAEDVDHIIVADNNSTDNTRAVLEQHPDVTIIDDPEPGYYQDRKMTDLALMAHGMDAEWVLPFDADELWYAPDGTIGQALARTRHDVVMAAGWDHIARTPGEAPFSPWRRRQPQKLCKVAFRARPDIELNMGNHDVRPEWLSRGRGPLQYRHFQYRSLEQMTRKLRNGRAAYEASTVHELHGTHWREGGKLTDDEMAAKWDALCSEEGLVFDPAPIRVTA